MFFSPQKVGDGHTSKKGATDCGCQKQEDSIEAWIAIAWIGAKGGIDLWQEGRSRRELMGSFFFFKEEQ